MKNMIQKLNSKKGFTLMEMLIVVAIIAVLVAIAIPTFSSALTKAKEAADVANIRAAYADYQVAYLEEDTTALGTVTLGTTTNQGFVTAMLGNGITLNYNGTTVISADGVITYDPEKINSGAAYTWQLAK